MIRVLAAVGASDGGGLAANSAALCTTIGSMSS